MTEAARQFGGKGHALCPGFKYPAPPAALALAREIRLVAMATGGEWAGFVNRFRRL